MFLHFLTRPGKCDAVVAPPAPPSAGQWTVPGHTIGVPVKKFIKTDAVCLRQHCSKCKTTTYDGTGGRSLAKTAAPLRRTCQSKLATNSRAWSHIPHHAVYKRVGCCALGPTAEPLPSPSHRVCRQGPHHIGIDRITMSG